MCAAVNTLPNSPFSRPNDMKRLYTVDDWALPGNVMAFSDNAWAVGMKLEAIYRSDWVSHGVATIMQVADGAHRQQCALLRVSR